MYQPYYDDKSSSLYFADDTHGALAPFQGKINAFFCGALQHPQLMARILGYPPPFAPALTFGFRRANETIAGQSIPFMLP